MLNKLINLNISEKIIKNYFQILNEVDDIRVNYNISKIDLSEEEIDHQLNNNIKGKFIISNLKKEIKKLKNIYQITFENNSIIIFSNDIISDSIKIVSLLKIIKYLKVKGNNYNLNGFFYMTNIKRLLKKDIFDTISVNGGFTFLGNNRKMVVWRKEDGIKVFIHELIHYFDIDIFYRKYRHLNDFSNLKISQEKEFVFEAFTDFFAINYYMVYLSLISKDKSINFLYQNYINQYNFTLHQGFKIIKYSKLYDKKIIKNKTNVYCYYLLKLYLMIYHRNSNLKEINIPELIENSYKLYTIPLIKKYINKLDLDRNLRMAYQQVYL